MADPQFVQTFAGHRGSVSSTSWSPDGSFLATAGDDGKVLLWRMSVSRNIAKLDCGSSVTSLSCGNSLVVAACSDATVRLFKIDAKSTSTYRTHQTPTRCVELNRDGSQFVTASDDKTAKIWSTTSPNKFVRSFSGGHTNWVRTAKWCPVSNQLIATGGDDGKICIWDTRSPLRSPPSIVLAKLKSPVRSLAWHPSCHHLLSSGSPLRVWDLRSSSTVQYYEAHNQPITDISFHTSGKYIATSSYDSCTKIMDLLEGRVLFTLKGHQGPVMSAQISPDGHHLSTSGQDGNVLIWKTNLTSSQPALPASLSSPYPTSHTQHPIDSTDDDDRSQGPVDVILSQLLEIGTALKNVSERVSQIEARSR